MKKFQQIHIKQKMKQHTRHKQEKTPDGERALLYSPLAETRLTVYRQRQVSSYIDALRVLRAVTRLTVYRLLQYGIGLG